MNKIEWNEDDYPVEIYIEALNSIPESIKLEAVEWGIDDTEVHSAIYMHWFNNGVPDCIKNFKGSTK